VIAFDVVFSEPDPLNPDIAANACEAAVDMLERIDELNRIARRKCRTAVLPIFRSMSASV
jgi:hypothetical protein